MNSHRVISRRIQLFVLVSIFSIALVYPRTGIDTKLEGESNCEAILENIFKAHDLKVRYETAQYIYQSKGFEKNDPLLNSFFEQIKGFPYFEKQQDSTLALKSGEWVKVEFMSNEEVSRYFEQLNYTPGEAYEDYKAFLQDMRLEKETYLPCIDAELAKGEASEYAKKEIFYSFKPPLSSQLPPRITRLDFLKLFKEFVLNTPNGMIPDSLRAYAFLHCGCKIPPFYSLSPTRSGE